MRKIYTAAAVAAALFMAGLAQAQGSASAAEAKPQTQYFDAEDKILPSATGAQYWVETVRKGKKAGLTSEFFQSGKLRKTVAYSNLVATYRQGPAITYYESGQVHAKEAFVRGRREGELLVYYENGQLKRREQYKGGELQKSECFAPDGSAVPTTPYEMMPTYQGGGNDVIVGIIQRAVRYPDAALRAAAQGRVFVGFDVNHLGTVQNVHVVKGAAPALDEEGMRAVGAMGKFAPGTVDGEPVLVSYTVPVNFRIK